MKRTGFLLGCLALAAVALPAGAASAYTYECEDDAPLEIRCTVDGKNTEVCVYPSFCNQPYLTAKQSYEEAEAIVNQILADSAVTALQSELCEQYLQNQPAKLCDPVRLPRVIKNFP